MFAHGIGLERRHVRPLVALGARVRLSRSFNGELMPAVTRHAQALAPIRVVPAHTLIWPTTYLGEFHLAEITVPLFHTSNFQSGSVAVIAGFRARFSRQGPQCSTSYREKTAHR